MTTADWRRGGAMNFDGTAARMAKEEPTMATRATRGGLGGR